MKKLALIAAAAGLTACAQGSPEVNAPNRAAQARGERAAPAQRVDVDSLFSGQGAMITALGGRMEGQFAGFALNTATYQHDFYSDGYSANGHVYGGDAQGAAGMGIISIAGDLASAVPGQAYRSNGYYNEVGGEAGDLAGTFTACPAGDGTGWTTDEPATTTEIVLEMPTDEIGIPDGTIAELNILSHWDASVSYSGSEGTMKTRVYLTE